VNNSLIDEEQFSEVILNCIEKLNVKNTKKPLDYMEFGCYKGDSLIIANKILGDMCERYVAFDSFKGLPSNSSLDSDNLFFEGQFSCSQEEFIDNLIENRFPVEKLTVNSGFFKETLNKKYDYPKDFKIFMFDCDIYSSTVDALNFFVDYFEKECIVIFDDWFAGGINFYEKGQKKAFSEFKQKNANNIEFEDLFFYDYFGTLAGRYFYLRKK
jgi:hypothetical protein